MSWEPNKEETKFIDLILSMCVDCKMGNGVDNRETFFSNLNLIIDSMNELPKTKQKAEIEIDNEN